MRRKPRTTPVNRAREFALNQLFFSTTDRKGVITGCNEVFIAISGFSPEELLGKAHSVIRHPEVPRCVFKLLWEYLQAGKPIGAYVKNMAKTGEFYWVFALVMPIEGGFLSIRLKPSSPIFTTVEGLYKQLLAIEEADPENWRQGMEESFTALSAAIASLGFASYDSFMAIALKAELDAREEGLLRGSKRVNTPLHAIMNELSSVEKLQGAISSKRVFFDSLGGKISKVALNVSIAAAKLAEAGKALGVISDEVSRVASVISEEANVLKEETDTLTSRLYDTLFYVSFCVLFEEITIQLQETAVDPELSAEEQVERYGDMIDNQILLLSTMYASSLETCNANVLTLLQALKSTEVFYGSLGKVLLNLHLGYIIGKSTAASLENGEQFTLLLDEVLDLANLSKVELEEMKETVHSVRQIVVGWISHSVFALRA